SSVTTILAILVGSSEVSAITHTPASGPFGPLTTPPRSVGPMLTLCCASSRAGDPVRNAAIATAATPEYKPLYLPIVMLLRFLPGLVPRCYDGNDSMRRSRRRPPRQPSSGAAPPLRCRPITNGEVAMGWAKQGSCCLALLASLALAGVAQAQGQATVFEGAR